MPGRRRRRRGGGREQPTVTIQRWLEPCLLLILRRASGPSHGYDLAQALSEFGMADADPSLVYRALRAMEGEGLVQSAWDATGSGPARRNYALTLAGGRELDAWVGELRATRDALDRFLDTYEQESPSEP